MWAAECRCARKMWKEERKVNRKMKEDGRINEGGAGNSGRSCMHLVSGLSRCLLHFSFPASVLLAAVQIIAASDTLCLLSVYSLLTLIARSQRTNTNNTDKLDKFRHTKPPAGTPQITPHSVPQASKTGVVIRSSNSKQNFRFLSSAKHNSYTNRKTLSKSTAGGRRAE